MKHDFKKIQDFDRNQLKAYCDANNFVYRTKDSTDDIKKKFIKFLSASGDSTPTNIKSTKKVEKKVDIKKIETKKVDDKKKDSKKKDNGVGSVVKSVKDKIVKPKKEVVETQIKDQISFRQVGQNIILNIDNTSYSKKVEDKSTRDDIKQKVLSYNTKNTKELKDELIIFFKSKVDIAKPIDDKSSLESLSNEDLLNTITDPVLREEMRKRFSEKEVAVNRSVNDDKKNAVIPPVQKSSNKEY